MTRKILPCGCMIQWDDETTVVFCNRHTAEYVRWEGSDRGFIKAIATPPKIDRTPMVEMQ